MANVVSSLEDDLPGLFVEADTYAIRWQRAYLALERVQLIALVAAAAISATSGFGWRIAAFSGIVIAFTAQFVRAVTGANRRWWEGRAVAESNKTVSWRFAVGGAPFPIEGGGTDELFADRLREIAEDAGEFVSNGSEGFAATPSMLAARASRLEYRVDTYRTQRIARQGAWYRSASERNGRMAAIWTGVALLLQAFALLLGALTLRDTWAFPEWSELDFGHVGVLTSAVAAVVAWMAVKQHDLLKQSYSVAATELARIERLRQADTPSEETWPGHVDLAEEAISREHTSWIASKNV